MSMQMKVPPTFYKLNYLSDGSFTTSTISFLDLTIRLETRVRTIGVWTILESSLIPNEDDAGLQILFMQEPVFCSQFLKRGKSVRGGVINRDLIMLERAVDGEKIVEVNKILTEIELVVDQDRLLCLLFLEHESLYSSLWIYNRLKHNLIFLIKTVISNPNKRPILLIIHYSTFFIRCMLVLFQANLNALFINVFSSLKEFNFYCSFTLLQGLNLAIIFITSSKFNKPILFTIINLTLIMVNKVAILCNYNVDNSQKMLKFRALKDKIVCSKRHSQKLSQEELFSLTEQHSLSRLNLSLSNKLHAEVHQITDQDYKIAYKMKSGSRDSGKKLKQREEVLERVRTEYVQATGNAENYDSNCLDFQQTTKKANHLTKSIIQGSNFNKMVELLREVIALKKMRADCPRESAFLGMAMRQKLELMKVLLRTLEDDSQKSLIDFYNQDKQDAHSPHSFHSQDSDETYQPQSQREAYELSERKDTNSTEEQEEITQIKYRRLTPNNCQEGSIYEMFSDEDKEQRPQPECQPFQEGSEKSIVHLFSYQKDVSIGTPLSKITEREQEYFSPESKQSSLAASLEYKKIYYLLETSGKKEDTYRREVSEFTPSKSSIISHNESKDRSRCHEQLGEMISLLENKYNRKVKIGVENLMDSLNLAIKDKNIKLRKK